MSDGNRAAFSRKNAKTSWQRPQSETQILQRRRLNTDTLCEWKPCWRLRHALQSFAFLLPLLALGCRDYLQSVLFFFSLSPRSYPPARLPFLPDANVMSGLWWERKYCCESGELAWTSPEETTDWLPHLPPFPSFFFLSSSQSAHSWETIWPYHFTGTI